MRSWEELSYFSKRNAWRNFGTYEVPILGDNVTVGAGANIIGPVHVGNNVEIGAGAVVIRDIPDDCIAVGVQQKL